MFWSGGFAYVPFKIWDNPPGGHVVVQAIDTETGIEYVGAVFDHDPDRVVVYYA